MYNYNVSLSIYIYIYHFSDVGIRKRISPAAVDMSRKCGTSRKLTDPGRVYYDM